MRIPAVLAFSAVVLLALLPRPALGQEAPCEVYALSNGLTVILHEDHRLPQTVVSVRYGVGSKDEAPGRSGFAHLFEHLMFMGTDRVPGNQFDVIMETGGGSNNANTSTDRTYYYSMGPASLLPTLLWLDADRMEGLGKAMTQQKLDLQRDVVRNERRQNYENEPYAKAFLALPEALFPQGHPYRHPVIGNHEDLQAATLQNVKDFFSTYYVPANAVLAVSGDFRPSEVKPLIERLFGAVPPASAPSPVTAEPVKLEREVRRLVTDRVEYPKLLLVWPSPAAYEEGDAALDLAAGVLARGSTGRLYERLVLKERTARSVQVYQGSAELGSQFAVDVTAAEGADLEQIKRAVLEEVEKLKAEGPTEGELVRVKAQLESVFLKAMEDLPGKAYMLTEYYHFYGDPDGFKRDLKRYAAPTPQEVRDWARRVLGRGRVDLRVLPEGAGNPASNLDQRPKDLPAGAFTFPPAQSLTLENGIPLVVVRCPGAGLFSGWLLLDGGERLVPAEKAGLSALAAEMLRAGAGGLDAAAYSDAVASVGARVEAGSTWYEMYLSVDGLSSRLERTLDLFADAALRPNLKAADFEREKALQMAAIKARAEEPDTVAALASRALLFGREEAKGRPTAGYLETVQGLSLEQVVAALPALVNAANARFIFAGDVDPAALKAALDRRFAGWSRAAAKAPPLPPAAEAAVAGRIALVHRPEAPQTVISLARPVSLPGERQRVVRECLNGLFGGSFTSRLMQNIREKHGYSYGARSWFQQDANQGTLRASTSVQTAVTGAALKEMKKEFDALAKGGVQPEELAKAARTMQFDTVSEAGTTESLALAYAELVEEGRPLDSIPKELAALDTLRLEDLDTEARSGIYAWDGLLVVLVGDKSAILPQLKAEGFPEPVLVDLEGRPLQ